MEITQNDDRIPMEVSFTSESIVGNNKDNFASANPYSSTASSINTREVLTKFKTDIERQAQISTREIVRGL
jgi:hypothetical protein